jgi:hypothetical protein
MANKHSDVSELQHNVFMFQMMSEQQKLCRLTGYYGFDISGSHLCAKTHKDEIR